MPLTSLRIEESIHIAAPPESVWKFLADLHSWHDGSSFLLAVHLGWLTLKFKARVEAATPPRSLLWVASGGGVTARHAFFLDAKPNGTYVRQQESLGGPGLLFFRLARFDAASRRMFQQNLRGLKRIVERSG